MEYTKAKNKAKRRDKILKISTSRIRKKEDIKYGIYQGQE